MKLKIKIPSDEIISSINITPFTDVILVLLIIFMISAPSIFLSSLQIQLPQGDTTKTPSQYTEMIGIDKEGIFYYKNRTVSLEELKNIFSKKPKEELNKIEILINADKDTKHGYVINLINELKNLNYTKIYVGTTK
ncbi:MAG: ExbD/TolR family protein [Leptonema sp. (in: bacteria)]